MQQTIHSKILTVIFRMQRKFLKNKSRALKSHFLGRKTHLIGKEMAILFYFRISFFAEVELLVSITTT
jgi:hypothetical protein